MATNVIFSRLYGRKLAFRPTAGVPLAVDVDDVHPAVLSYLKIDAESAKDQQRRSDLAWHARLVAERKALQEKYEAQERLRIEQAKANAEMARARAEERRQLEAAENERMKAFAEMRKADAAMIEALKPSQVINNSLSSAVFLRGW